MTAIEPQPGPVPGGSTGSVDKPAAEAHQLGDGRSVLGGPTPDPAPAAPAATPSRTPLAGERALRLAHEAMTMARAFLADGDAAAAELYFDLEDHLRRLASARIAQPIPGARQIHELLRCLDDVALISSKTQREASLTIRALLAPQSGVSGLRIVRAAIRDDWGGVYSLPAPARHGDVYRVLHENGVDDPGPSGQGFLTNLGEFVDRKLAVIVAERAGQILRKTGSPSELYSEDLW